MGNFLDLEGIDKKILDMITNLAVIREYAIAYAKQPSGEGGDAIAESVDKIASEFEGLKLRLARMVKVANNVDENEIIGVEGESGIEL
jgi:hypothetical protein